MHLGLVGVGLQGDGKTGLLQGLGDRFGIVDGVLEGAKRIVGIADDQRRARLGRLRLGERKREEQSDQTKTDRYETHRGDSTANRAPDFKGWVATDPANVPSPAYCRIADLSKPDDGRWHPW